MALASTADAGSSKANYTVYTPRLTCPDENDPKYVAKAYGGESPWPTDGRWGKTTMPNCTAYAWARWWEIAGSPPDIWGNASDWYANMDNYERSRDHGGQPQLGAIACYFQSTGHGHVAVVEEIKSDGTLVLSESGWDFSQNKWTDVFAIREVKPPKYLVSWMGDPRWHFQGFIYNPACGNLTSYLSLFLDRVKSMIGLTKSKVQQQLPEMQSKNWSVDFLRCCARKDKIPTSIIPDETSATAFLDNADAGELIGEDEQCQIGDIAVFKTKALGLIVDVNGETLTVICGDSGNADPTKSKVQSKNCSIYGLEGIWRPNWNAQLTSTNGLLFSETSQLYETSFEPGDACCREIGYLDSDYKPSINKSGIRLSVVNYTEYAQQFINFLNVFLQNNPYSDSPFQIGSTTRAYDNSATLTDVTGIQLAIFEHYRSKGVTLAATIAIMANMMMESSFQLNAHGNPNARDNSYGLIMWNKAAGQDLVGWCEARGYDWQTDLSAQLEFFDQFVVSDANLAWGWEELMKFPDTLEGAQAAARWFCRIFEYYCIFEEPIWLFTEPLRYPKRTEFATEFWNKLVIQQQDSKTGKKPLLNNTAEVV